MIKVADRKAYRSDKVLANTTGSSGAKIVHKIESPTEQKCPDLVPTSAGAAQGRYGPCLKSEVCLEHATARDC